MVIIAKKNAGTVRYQQSTNLMFYNNVNRISDKTIIKTVTYFDKHKTSDNIRKKHI
jgi:hypothetical protein